jgi:hypothetical protein
MRAGTFSKMLDNRQSLLVAVDGKKPTDRLSISGLHWIMDI